MAQEEFYWYSVVVIGILEGYSRSVSPVDLSEMVMSHFSDLNTITRIKKSLFGRHQVRRYVSFVRKHQSHDNVLFLVGKSLGGRNILRVYNEAIPTKYKAVVLFTIDVNYPIRGNWTPNLNRVYMPLRKTPTRGLNIYNGTVDHNAQAGARVSHMHNMSVSGENHQTITGCALVRDNLLYLVEYVKWRDQS